MFMRVNVDNILAMQNKQCLTLENIVLSFLRHRDISLSTFFHTILSEIHEFLSEPAVTSRIYLKKMLLFISFGTRGYLKKTVYICYIISTQ